jgi:hypothetical protein
VAGGATPHHNEARRAMAAYVIVDVEVTDPEAYEELSAARPGHP